MTKVFVTKYALSTGVFSAEAECKCGSDMAVIPGDRAKGYFDQYLHKGDFHFDVESALQKAEEMRIKKLKSLDKQMKKVSAIKFEVKHG
jgi:hypothetical protein